MPSRRACRRRQCFFSSRPIRRVARLINVITILYLRRRFEDPRERRGVCAGPVSESCRAPVGDRHLLEALDLPGQPPERPGNGLDRPGHELEAVTSVDWVTFRDVATTLNPRSTNAFTMPAPIPWDAPVTMAVFRWPVTGSLRIIKVSAGWR